MYGQVHATAFKQNYLELEGDKIQSGFQLFNSFRIGYHIEIFKNRLFIEPSVCMTWWDYILENQSKFSLHSHADIITIEAHSTTLIQVKTLEILSSYNLRFKVLNAYVASNKHPEIVLLIEAKEN